jgi:hypothetical protein
LSKRRKRGGGRIRTDEPEWVTDWSQNSQNKAILAGQGNIQESAKWLLGSTLRNTWQRAVIVLYNPASGTNLSHPFEKKQVGH